MEEAFRLEPSVDESSVVILYKGGRLPSWHGLPDKDQQTYSNKHIDLMLSIAQKHWLMTLEGFKLFSSVGNWSRFWTIEFPTFEGAEEWIKSEIEPPYGRYGYYEYYLSRRLDIGDLNSWIVNPPPPVAIKPINPGIQPLLKIDRDSVVVITFSRWLPDADIVSPKDRGDKKYIEAMISVARKHRLMRLEAYQLIAPQPDWHHVWITEFPTLEGAEAWMSAELDSPHSRYTTKSYYLTRKWAPEYFAGWIPS